jgi:2-iminoacetate synthase
MRLFAPLYLSNECVNNCQYCGFSRDNPILRVTLTVDEVVAEGQHLARQGFRQILLVAGEHPKFVSGSYLAECVRALAVDFSSISIEVGTDGYRRLLADYRRLAPKGSSSYQETYNRGVYAEMHTGRAETRFQLSTRLRGARLCGRFSPARNRRAHRINAVAG